MVGNEDTLYRLFSERGERLQKRFGTPMPLIVDELENFITGTSSKVNLYIEHPPTKFTSSQTSSLGC
jgi:hypothetical protein